MQAGVAYCDAKVPFAAGFQLARDAATQANIAEVAVLLLFCNAATDYQRLLDGARQYCGGNTIIIGGSAVGVITNNHLVSGGQPAAAMALAATDVDFFPALAEQLSRDPSAAGASLAEQLAPNNNAKLLLLFYDSIRYAGNAQQPAILNPSPPLLKALRKPLPAKLPIAGAGLLADLVFGPTKQFFQRQLTDNAALALQFSGNLRPYIVAMHGCEPFTPRSFTITRSFGQFIYELDKQPVCAVLDQVIGTRSWRNQKPVLDFALGVKYPEQTHNLYSTSYVTRLINGVLPNDEGIILFEPDLAEGTTVHLMQRNSQSILAAATNQLKALFTQMRAEQSQPVAALYFDCAGRMTGSKAEAVLIQQQLTAAQIPMLGIYCGVEIAPIGNESRSLDWSAVLVLLSQPHSTEMNNPVADL
jgi:hypothetical protein